jgi:hypothetical protein
VNASLTVSDREITRKGSFRNFSGASLDTPGVMRKLNRLRTVVRLTCHTADVAGGMIPGRSGRSLQERAANSGVPSSAEPTEEFRPALGAAARAAGDGGEGRHCWVRNPPEARGVWPGLLVEWRQHAEGWQGRVVYTITGHRGATVVESWLPAKLLEPR